MTTRERIEQAYELRNRLLNSVQHLAPGQLARLVAAVARFTPQAWSDLIDYVEGIALWMPPPSE